MVATDLTVMLDDRPGTLAALGEATGAAGVNIDGLCGFSTGGGKTEIHVLVDDAAGARLALEGAGLQVTAERDVVLVDVQDRPGMLGEVSRKIADAGANIEVVYLATNTRLVVGADDLGKVRSAIS